MYIHCTLFDQLMLAMYWFWVVYFQVNSGARLLQDVRSDLNDVVEVCEVKRKQTNYLRSLISDLAKGQHLLQYNFNLTLTHTLSTLLPFSLGIIPRSWRRYTVPAGLTVIQWVTDFSDRVKQLQYISQQVGNNSSKVLKVNICHYKYCCTFNNNSLY